jgi:hypothetical protein
MSKYRLIHTQNTEGKLLVSDIDQGLPNERFGIYRKQEVYVPYYRLSTNVAPSGEVTVSEDRNHAGFVDLVKTDKVRESVANGVISELETQNFLNKVEFVDSDLDEPTISSAKFDDGTSTEVFEFDVTITDGTSVAEDYEVTINNANITSTTISFTDPTAGADESSTIASGLASNINGNGTVSSEVEANASGSTLTITTLKEDTPFTVSVNATDPDGSISSSEVATGRVIVTGTDFNSVEPFDAQITIEDTSSGESVTFTQTEVTGNSGLYSDTTIVVLNSQHSLGTSSGDVEDVTVSANNKTDSSSVTDV